MSDHLFDLIKEHVSIFDMMKEYAPDSYAAVRSEQVGHKIPCPFAADRHARGADSSPSAKFFPENQSLYCWTCHGSWDVIAFYAEANQLYKEDEQGRPMHDAKGGYQLNYGRAAGELGRKYQIDYVVPDWYSKLRRTIGALKHAERPVPALAQTRSLSDVYAAKAQGITPDTVLGLAVQDYAMGCKPDGSWSGVERDMHEWYEWFSGVLAEVSPPSYTPVP
jgi:hypothetical protein